MGRTFYREQKYICGKYMDVQVFPVYPKAKGRGPKRKPTSVVQEKLNQDNASKWLARLVHTNFTSDDYALHLTYAKEHEPKAAEHVRRDAQNFIRRLKRAYAKEGITLKYIWGSGRGSEHGRFHHHLIITGGIGRTTVERIWGKGYANSKSLQFSETGVGGLAHYISRHKLFYRSWSCSKNLKKPEAPRPSDCRINRKRAKEMAEDPTDTAVFEKLYPGYILGKCEPLLNERNGGYYLTIRLYRKDVLLI